MCRLFPEKFSICFSAMVACQLIVFAEVISLFNAQQLADSKKKFLFFFCCKMFLFGAGRCKQ
uniref:Uncharacterized protein n=1 Tax=Arundo donax TaxID=35708 RepID=A0A0A9F9M1_ARUDO